MNQMKIPCAGTPARFWSSWPARRAAPRSPRFRGISGRLLAAALTLAAAAGPIGAGAATPSPHPSATPRRARVDVTKVQPKALLPKRAEHQEYVVEINKYGQVARVRTEHGNGDPTFNAQTYGNALQAFIRTPDGHVILGTYRLTYDYDPKTGRVRRDVTLLSQGGVNPDAEGAVHDLLRLAHTHTPIPIAPNPNSIDPRDLPNLGGIDPPTPTPTSSP